MEQAKSKLSRWFDDEEITEMGDIFDPDEV
jgi:hypothetical protein